MTLRRMRRSGALGWALLLCLIRLGLTRLRGPLSDVQRAVWLQGACRGVLRAAGVRVDVSGTPPLHGLIVSNHLSYLDIAVYSATVPCSFVSKAEVRQWPYFGFAARAGGTIFLDRSSRASAGIAAAEIAHRLRVPVPVLLFPEGTSSDGSAVLPFHSSLYHPATEMRVPVTAAAVRYISEGETPERELCWFGNAEFLPHLWKVLAAPAFTAEIRFDAPRTYPDRRTAAVDTHRRVAALRAGAAAEAALCS